jgi:ABC-type transport system involved in cytochrome c biogenesis ATPase subunit
VLRFWKAGLISNGFTGLSELSHKLMVLGHDDGVGEELQLWNELEFLDVCARSSNHVSVKSR